MPPPARRLVRLTLAWTALGYAAPIYPLYALLFLATGLSEAEVSGLFTVWSVVGFFAEVPTGALADRWSRRGCLVLGSCLEALAFTVWTLLPGLPGFAGGFVLWGVAGALHSGTVEALVYDSLVAVRAAEAYPRVSGWISAAQQLASLPTAAAASALFALGGYPLVGWVSVGICLATAALGLRFRDVPAVGGEKGEEGEAAAEIEAGEGGPAAVARVLRRPAVALLVGAVALVSGVDAIEEYFPVLAGGWGVPTTAVPAVLLVLPLAAALGGALAGRAARLPSGPLAAVLAAAGAALAVAAEWARPAALAAVAVFYGLYSAVLVVARARLQDRISGRYRATVTSVAAVGTELASLALYGAWAVRGALGVAVLVGAAAAVLARALTGPAPDPPGHSSTG